MNYTSIEQSKKLLELGLSPETADMFYPNAPITVPCVDDGRNKGSIFIPCWSVGALLKVMPKWNDYSPYIGKNECIYSNDDNEIYHGEDGAPIEAAYEMVVWLLENGYIKKEE